MRTVVFLSALYFVALFVNSEYNEKELVVLENNSDSEQVTFNQNASLLEKETFDFNNNK